MSVPLPHVFLDVAPHTLPTYEPSHGRRTRAHLTLVPALGGSAELAPPEVLWRLVRQVLEVLNGRRPPVHLRGPLSARAYESLLTWARMTRPGRRHRIRRIHHALPTPTTIEACAVIELTGAGAPARVRAAALRLDRTAVRWHCTVLHIL